MHGQPHIRFNKFILRVSVTILMNQVYRTIKYQIEEHKQLVLLDNGHYIH